MNGNTSKIDLRCTGDKVIFLFCDCSLDREYSFYRMERCQAEMLMCRLKYIEQLTWSQFSALSKEKCGLISEKPDSDSFKMIDLQNTSPEKMGGEKYYFHFHVKYGDLFRVFGYQKKQFFCITHLDRKGQIHDH